MAGQAAAATILLVGGDREGIDIVRYALAREVYDVDIVATVREAVGRARAGAVDLVIVDADSADGGPGAILPALRAASRTPVIVLTARAADEDVLAAFRAGADDCVTKPFSVQILVARVQALLRRARPGPAAPGAGGAYEIDGVTFDSAANALLGRGRRIHLTPNEGRILRLLAGHPGHALSPELIAERAGLRDEGAGGTGVVRTHVYHLRDKLARVSGKSDLIRTVPGAGYSLAAAASRHEGDGDAVE